MLLFDKNRLKVPYAEPYLAALLSASIILVLPIIVLVVLSTAKVRQRAHIASTRRSGALWSSRPGSRGCWGSAEGAASLAGHTGWHLPGTEPGNMDSESCCDLSHIGHDGSVGCRDLVSV